MSCSYVKQVIHGEVIRTHIIPFLKHTHDNMKVMVNSLDCHQCGASEQEGVAMGRVIISFMITQQLIGDR